MANKKSKDPEQPDPQQLLQKRVDEMMDIKGNKTATPSPGEDSAVSEVAASINQSLSESLSSKEPSLPEAEVTESKTAPELPTEPETESVPETPAEEEVPEPEPELPAEPPTAEESEPTPIPDSDIDDSYTEKAVDDIVAEESDQLLAVEDEKTQDADQAVVSKVGFKDKIRGLFAHRHFWIMFVVLLLVVFTVPATRYKILGLVVKKSVTVTVLDSKTSSPVSNAEVVLAGSTAKTDANGKAVISAGLGKRELTVSKRYYTTLDSSFFVGFKPANSPVKLTATGRLVPVVVVNKISGKPIAGAQIQAQGTNSKTNSKGQAEIALPTKAATYPAKIVSKGSNAADVTIVVTDKIDKANTFQITPSGQVYFLSNRNGTLDVVKSDLDGTNRKTVLAGTGKEDPRTTSLLASRDWRYLVLKAHREGNLASLYLIDTSNDKLTQFDNGDADFSLIGWHDHNFIYSLNRNNLTYSQEGKQAIKSYNADHLQLNQLDKTLVEGTAGNVIYQSFTNFYILNDLVVYTTQWNREGNTATIAADKNDTIRGVQPSGQNKKDYQSFSSANNNYIQATPYEPQGIYFAIYDNNSKPTFYEFKNKAVKPASIDQATFDKIYPTFLLSPNGNQTLWTELRDGKNAIFTGDASAGSKKQVAGLSEYSPYGWFGDSYILVTKNSSELYIVPATGLSAGQSPLKVTDYYKPAQTYAGYGYGGL